MSDQKIKIIFLPGLNGTDGLFKAFISCCPDQYEVIPFSYPTDEKLSYQALTGSIVEKINKISGSIILLGESFSGPLSLLAANAIPNKVKAVILVVSFVLPPRHTILKILPWEFGFVLTKPLYWLSSRLTNSSKNSGIIDAIGIEMRKVKPAVLAYRVKETLSVNAVDALRSCSCPILYVQAEKDIIVPKAALGEILEIKKTVQVSTFPSQHFVLQSLPKEVWLSITQFLSVNIS